MLDARGRSFRTLNTLSDRDLVVLAQEGTLEAEAIQVLLSRHQDRVYSWCYRWVREHEKALDLVQESLLDAWSGLPEFQGRGCFSSWLFSVTRRRCLKAFRRASLVRDEESDPDDFADISRGYDEVIAGEEAEERVLRLIRQHLNPSERMAIWMRCIEGLPVIDITTALGLKRASGARGVLQTARRKLRAVFDRDRIRQGFVHTD